MKVAPAVRKHPGTVATTYERGGNMVECSVPGCTNEARVVRRKLCSKHYQRWRNHGDPLATKRPGLGLTVEERFWRSVNTAGPVPIERPHLGPCWIWTGGTTSAGYGKLHGSGGAGLTHRFAYQLLVGPVPDGLELDHLCRVRLCCRPKHLEPVTHAENVRRGLLPIQNRQRGALITHCIHGHEFTPENTIKRKAGGRQCRECMNRQQREYQARKRLRAS